MNKVAVIVNSCDKFEFIWESWFHWWDKYWDKNINWKIYFITECVFHRVSLVLVNQKIFLKNAVELTVEIFNNFVTSTIVLWADLLMRATLCITDEESAVTDFNQRKVTLC